MTSHINGWWFSAGKTLPHGDGRRIKIGRTHKVEGAIVPCSNGLHLSQRAIDALDYAPGPIVWKVRGSDIIIPNGNDKHACSERTYIAGGIDVSDTLRAFARKCALDVIDFWDASKNVIRCLRTGNESIREAALEEAEAEGLAAWSALVALQRDLSVVHSATEAADASATAAAEAATDRVADGGVWGAAWNAEREKQNRRLTAMLNAAIKKTEAA